MNFRPKAGESDEDLIRQNEELLRSVRKKATEIEEHSPKEKREQQKPKDNGNDYIFNDPEAILKQAKSPGILLTDIYEKTEKTLNLKSIQPPVATSSGFPSAFARDKKITAGGSKKSIFAMMQQKKSAEAEGHQIEKVDLGAQQAIKNVFGPSEAQKIHEESVQKLSTLSEEQILEERSRLLASLNPETLKFFTNRGAKGKITPVKEEAEPVASKISKKEIEEPMEVEDLPIGPEEAKKWLHMDVVESEKLKWMKKLPTPKPLAPGDPYPARFDFEGNLLPANCDMPVTKALHHHGDEPERPGYTLEELLLFSRSSVMQQRAIGVSTIAKILKLAKEGRFDLCLEESIIPQLVGAGVFAILRFLLDDNVSMVVQAAADALSSLLSSEPDEVCLSLILGTNFGLSQPILACPPQPEQEMEKGETPVEDGELRDHELLQLDVIKGALRTDLIPRIRYLLEIIKPAPKTVISLLEILIRVARHSRESALAVGRCPGLMQTIIEQFLPSSWEATQKKPIEMVTVQGVPLAKALRLIRVVAAQSKAMSTDLVDKFNIMTPVLAYLASEPSETGIPDGASVLMESLYLWQTLLSYGLTLSEYSSFAPVLGHLLSFHLKNTQLRAKGTFFQEHAVALFSLLQRILKLGGHQQIAVELLSSIWIQTFRATASWITQASENLPLGFSDLKLVGTAIDTSNLIFNTLLCWDNIDAIALLTLMETVVKSSVIPFLLSETFQKMTKDIQLKSSLLQAQSVTGRQRDPKGLPSLGSVTFGQSITPVLQSTFYFLQPLISLINCATEKFHKIRQTLLDILINNEGLQGYLREIAANGCPGYDHWYSRVEIHLAVDLLILAAKCKINAQPERLILHRASLKLVPCTRAEDKNLLASLFRTWIFFDSFPSESISECFLEDRNTRDREYCQTIIKELPLIRDTYLTCFCLLEPVVAISQTNTISLKHEGQSMVPVDWPYLPLVKVIGQSTESKVKDKPSSSDEVYRGLQWVLILEATQPEVIDSMLSPTARFCRLACIFLADDCLFLEPNIEACLQQVLVSSLANMERLGKDFDFDENIPGLKDFWELYIHLVQQYSSESYGNALFANFVLIPLQQRFKVAFKNLIWGELVEVIRFLSLPIEKLIVPIEKYLTPLEKDESLLLLYLKDLRSGLIKPNWSPVLYKVATHHLIEYTKIGENKELASTIKLGLSTPEHFGLLTQ